MIRASRPANPGLQVYSFLARRRRPRSYLGKIMLVAFVGTHIPLLALLIYAINATAFPLEFKARILCVALCATLLGTGATLLILQKLLLPVTLTFRGLRQYREDNIVPTLPTEFLDEAGVLMADTVHTVTKLDDLIRQLRDYDALTGLPNRNYFQEAVEQALTAGAATKSRVAVVLLDIDEFAATNNTLGPEVGDKLLRLAASRLRLAANDTGVLSRTGSDEFAVLQSGVGSAENVYEQSRALMAIFAEPFEIEGQSVRITASVGIAIQMPGELVNGVAVRAEQVLTNADVALRGTKREGRGGLRFYSTRMNEALRQRLQIERELHEALEHNQLQLFYQPQIDLKAGKYTGVEALLRWKHPTRGWVSPNDFIHIAERSGLILPIGEWVLQRACVDNLEWQRAGHADQRMSVNLSPVQFQESRLAQTVRSVLESTRHAANLLDLEITEGVLMEDVESSADILSELKSLGVRISLDDFGTGYSSLTYLKRFPLDRLKIDQSFIRGIPEVRQDLAITQSIITLAECLQMDTIAEGVETMAQADYLRSHGCSHMQGFYFAKPMPAAELLRFWESPPPPVGALAQ